MRLPTNIGLAAESVYTSGVMDFLSNARLAARELDTLLIVARDLGHLGDADCSAMRETVERIRSAMTDHFKVPAS
jgi:hypothetical protein